ncbi:MAG: ATP-binding cassette domain-containing protein, partial [Planctomycetaceae bacterium]|nr:ATP-binding cassette domain-containing protein [Planctomycetaceae bacterium]
MQQSFELVDLSTGQAHLLDDSSESLAGRSTEARIFLYDLGCSRRQFRIVPRDGALVLEALSDSVPTYCDGKECSAPVPLREGLEIEVHQTKFRVRRVGGGDDSQSRSAAIVEACDIPLGQSFPVGEETTIGRDPTVDVYLPHIQVSRRHARLRIVPEGAIVEDLGSANGTFLEGRRLLLPQRMAPGATIGIGPYSLTFTGSALVSETRTNNLQIEGRSLTRWVNDQGQTSQRKTILDDVSLVIRPHEFVCLLGPTGSGKSTLLAALSARVPANQGQVLINQANLYEHFDSLKRDIAVVPQRDILHDELPLADALRYTAKLRLPIDTSATEMNAQVDDLLQRVGLQAHRQTRLGQLSGGQRRRASLANELISNPSLLFLDEVTSGLDEQTDREMMRLFRRLADAGKTVVCVTHTLANIAETCHLIVLLTV